MTAWQSDIIELADDLEAFNEYAVAQRWSDGLPLIPPTAGRVERMLAGSRQTAGGGRGVHHREDGHQRGHGRMPTGLYAAAHRCGASRGAARL
jgi:hypothetical protein